jgi:hypothetical protein
MAVLPPCLDACADAKNRCQVHVNGHRHRKWAAAKNKQATLLFTPEDPGARSK